MIKKIFIGITTIMLLWTGLNAQSSSTEKTVGKSVDSRPDPKVMYIKEINIQKQKASVYYTSYKKIIDEFKHTNYTTKAGFCTNFINDFKLDQKVYLIKPSVIANNFHDKKLQKYLHVFPSWVVSKLKERLYLSEENKYDERDRKGSNRDDYLYEANLIKLYDVDLDSNQVTPNNIFILVDAFYGGKDLGLFGEKRHMSGTYEENDNPLSIYAVLDREKLIINSFDYVFGTVSRYQENSNIRELIKYNNSYYVFTALYNKEKRQYDRVYLKYFQKSNKTNFENVQYRKKCVIKIEE